MGSILGERFFWRELLSEMSISYFIFIFSFYLFLQTLVDDSTELDIRWKKNNNNKKVTNKIYKERKVRTI